MLSGFLKLFIEPRQTSALIDHQNLYVQWAYQFIIMTHNRKSHTMIILQEDDPINSVESSSKDGYLSFVLCIFEMLYTKFSFYCNPDI